MNEIWKDIKGYEGIYQVSTFGRVKSLARTIPVKTRWNSYCDRKLSEKILKPVDNGHGYLFVTLVIDGDVTQKYIHRLVAETFIQNPNDLSEVNHKDGDKGNNNVDNLEWVTPSYNMKHSYDIGLHKPLTRPLNNCKLSSEMVNEIRLRNQNGESQAKLSRELNIPPSTIQAVCSGTTWRWLQ